MTNYDEEKVKEMYDKAKGFGKEEEARLMVRHQQKIINDIAMPAITQLERLHDDMFEKEVPADAIDRMHTINTYSVVLNILFNAIEFPDREYFLESFDNAMDSAKRIRK